MLACYAFAQEDTGEVEDLELEGKKNKK